MKLILLVSVEKFHFMSRLRPVAGWSNRHLTYMIKFKCEGCRWKSMPVPLKASHTVRRGVKMFNAVEACPGCGDVGRVRILQTMGMPILEEGGRMPVMVLEARGLPLDGSFVHFAFQWTAYSTLLGGPVPPFTLRNGSYMMDMPDQFLPDGAYPPAAMDVRGFYMIVMD